VECSEIVVAIKAVTSGLVVLPRELLPTLLNVGSNADEVLDGSDAVGTLLTARELEVLAALADGASKKAIARRLGIPFHTARFHVVAILTSSMRTAGLKRSQGCATWSRNALNREVHFFVLFLGPMSLWIY
jgi:FixJ family two-component response regulator